MLFGFEFILSRLSSFFSEMLEFTVTLCRPIWQCSLHKQRAQKLVSGTDHRNLRLGLHAVWRAQLAENCHGCLDWMAFAQRYNMNVVKICTPLPMRSRAVGSTEHLRRKRLNNFLIPSPFRDCKENAEFILVCFKEGAARWPHPSRLGLLVPQHESESGTISVSVSQP
jgi:hypothetical protein